MKTARILAHLLYGSNGIAALTFAAVWASPGLMDTLEAGRMGVV